MASFDYRLNPLYTIKECSSCGALYTTDYCCSKGSLVDKIIRERPPQNCATCGDPVDGLYCRPCAFVRKCLNEDLIKKIPICYDDDEDYTIAITPVLSTKEPVDSLIMEDEHLDAIPATESNEVIKSSVENLVPTPSESEGIPDKMCDVPLCDHPTPLEAFKEHSEIVVEFNDDSTSSDDDSPYGEDIDNVNASPPDSELVSLEVVENIEAMNSNPPPSSNFVTKSFSTSLNLFLEETNTFDNSLIESETFCFDLEENSSGSTTLLSELFYCPDYEGFYLDYDHIEEKEYWQYHNSC
ncbi:hypothetical protein Tco_0335685 [Tanacetum coccineum]